ncbi:MAG: glycosyl transferase family 1 [Caulobacteraceae bacterium]|nr:glycosyl transferase family 1 [Caulobacteraceae bacterium]
MVTILFDVTRLFMRASRTSPTGIDRVTQAYGRWLLSCPDIDTIPVCSLGGVITSLSSASFRRVVEDRPPEREAAADDWRRLVEALTAPAGGAPGHDGLALRLTAARTSRETRPARYLRFALGLAANWRPRRHRPGAVYLNVSHFGLEQPRLLDRLSAKGVRTVAMIHDLIPILHPEYCSPSALGWHLRRVEALLEHAALVIANSTSTADELTAYADGAGHRTPPICVAPLGLEASFHVRPEHGLGQRPYFVCVGTIEPRKNVILLLTLWRRLAERMGDATPPLVVAGQRGWESEAIADHLDRSPPVRRFVHEINGLGDAQLARLIAGGRALLSPSFMEGFNLPIAEALSMGTPVIASDIAVHRELAPGARLIDPLDGPAWLEAIEDAIRGGPDWNSSAARVSPPAGWPEHFAIVARALGLQELRGGGLA